MGPDRLSGRAFRTHNYENDYGRITAGDGLGVEDAGAVPLPLVVGGLTRVLRWVGAVGVAFAGN